MESSFYVLSFRPALGGVSVAMVVAMREGLVVGLKYGLVLCILIVYKD